MRQPGNYVPHLFTLLLIALGAAMPWLVSGAQDARIGRLQENLELNAVSLTLQKEASAEPALKVAAREHTAILWEEETRMTQGEAFQAAVAVIDQMSRYDLVPAEEACLLAEEGGWAEPLLYIGEDGGTALVWACYWKAIPCVVAVDDASGKAVQFLIDGPGWKEEPESPVQAGKQEQWNLFFQDYYGAELEQVEGLSLNIYEDFTSFNYY